VGEAREERMTGPFLQEYLGIKGGEIFIGLLDENNDPLGLTGRDDYKKHLIERGKKEE